MECTYCHSPLEHEACFCPHCGTRQDVGTTQHDNTSQPAANGGPRDYAAFISYRHRQPDADVARRLHRAIETYRLPAHAAKQYGQRRLGRVFRDQDELPATGSLPDSIRDALRRSHSLVVVCSPETPKSRWVRQEIETFASFHGRDHIFAVLAEGASAESLPDILRFRTRVEPDGTAGQVPTEPLAADLRPAARSRRRQEQLRLIAGIADCAYDDLAQRDQTRRRKLAAIGIAIALALSATIGSLVTQAATQREAAQIQESQRLAAQSQQLLAQGDRYAAIAAALEALPTSASDHSRPLVPEAQTALENALYLNPGSSPWRSGYRFDTAHSLGILGDISMQNPQGKEPAGSGAIAVCPEGNYFAIADDTGEVNAYNLETGKHLARCRLASSPAGNSFSARILGATPDRLIASDPTHATLACFKMPSGTRLWSYDTLSIPALSTTPDGSIADIAEFSSDAGFSAAAVDMESGKLVAAAVPGGSNFPALGHGPRSTMGASANDFYVAVGNRLSRVDLTGNSLVSTTLSFPEISSLTYDNGMLIACTVETYDEEELELRYRVEAFDENLSPRWSFGGNVTSEMISGDDQEALVQGWPDVQGFTLAEDAVVLSAGRNVYVLDRATGETLYEHGFASTVLDVLPCTPAEPGAYRLLITTVDGTIAMENPESPTRNYDGDSYRMQLGFPLRWSNVSERDGVLTWLSVPALESGQVVAFHVDMLANGENGREYTLDELLAQADEVLQAAGQ